MTGMLEEKDYTAIDTTFLFISAFIDCETEFKDISLLPKVHSLFSDTFEEFLYNFVFYYKMVVAELS